MSTWIQQRMKFRQDLDSIGDLHKWLQNKNDITALEAKVLFGLHLEGQTYLKRRPVATVHKVNGPTSQLRTRRGLEQFEWAGTGTLTVMSSLSA